MSEPWDPAKAHANLRKHGVGLPEAVTIERDSRLLRRVDTLHSLTEERWILIGTSNRGRILRMTCVYRRGSIRPITARRATKRERDEYIHGTR